VEALDVGQRLMQNPRLLGGLRTVVEGRVHRFSRRFYKQKGPGMTPALLGVAEKLTGS
jgi:hypothetical protein